MAVLLVERSDATAVITLNRPEQRNALSRELRTRLVEAFGSLSGDSAVRVIVLTGAGKAFVRGWTLKNWVSSGCRREARERIRTRSTC